MFAMHTPWLAAVLAVAMIAPASAENRLGIWAGMSADQIVAALKPRCPDLIITGEDGRTITCRFGETEITAMTTTKDRTFYVAWSEPSDDEVTSYVRRIAGELGLSGPGEDCEFYGYELRCWHARDGATLYTGERDSRKRFVSYVVSDKVKEEDDGPSGEAPTTPQE
jgi:hypothetical protein